MCSLCLCGKRFELHTSENTVLLGKTGTQLYLETHLVNIDLFGVLHHFQYCTGHITMGSFVSREVLCCKLSTIGKQLPSLSHIRSGV